MSEKPTPSAEGLRRYPWTAGYHADISAAGLAPDLTLPCSCTAECARRCAGECGCSACELTFSEYCDEAGLYGMDGLQISEVEALARFRDTGAGDPAA